MDNMGKKVYMTMLILLLIPALQTSTRAMATLYVDPPTTVTSVGGTFSVNITVSDVIDLAGWEFRLYYLSSNLNGTNVEEGPLLKEGGSTYFAAINFTDDYNSTHGLAWVTCALLEGSGVNGDGTLAVVTFEAKQLGISDLSLTDTLLSDSEPIPHIALNGIVYILPHDVAITNVIPSKTIVGQGLTAKMDVSVLNEGNFTETFKVTVYANTTAIQTETLTLTSQSFTTLTFTWNTSGFAMGNYTLSAVADAVPGETDTEDNTFIDGWVYVGIPGDINADGIVEMMDFYYTSLAFGSEPGHPNWNPNTDVNDDNIVEMMDFYVLSQHFGQHYP
jgi:hypothetical protein